MTKITLYVYQREDGGTDVSPTMPPEGTEYTTKWRLIASEGKVITQDGINYYYCLDVDDDTGWYEMDDPTPPEPDPEDGDVE